MRRFLAGAATAVVASVAVFVTPALACGGLVAPDGDVHLDKATTFVAWHGGVERYVTSFAYTGSAVDVGWIVPLPAIPASIQPAGRWTLQRLELQFNPPVFDRALAGAGTSALAAAPSVVVEQVQVEALDVTVLEGSGQAVVDWCLHNGFLLPPETQDHLLRYAQGSPVFMAAKYDSAAAQQRGLRSGDGVPLLITMPTPQLWVPLEVLANDNDSVNADLFLLTDQQLRPAQRAPLVLPFFDQVQGASVDGATGFTVAGQQPMSDTLHRDLASDRNMSWVPEQGWLTYLRLNAPSDSVTYDLGTGSDGLIRLASFGTPPSRAAAATVPPPDPASPATLAVAAVAALGLAAMALAVARVSRGRGWRSGWARRRAARAR